MVANLTRGLMAGMLLCTAATAQEVLPDPTRPPSEISAPVTQTGHAVSKERGLQSVIISPTHRAAVINGQVVEPGEMTGDARLIEVNENGVVLQGVHGRQVLPLFPGVEISKKKSAAQNEAAPAAGKKPAGKTKKHHGKPVGHTAPPKQNRGEGK
ncbi:MAG: hypothetical protein HY306_12405 [Nitrosomonadales bacterium]|nr:hypothetical protein [Nitrosomonadales bacterium]